MLGEGRQLNFSNRIDREKQDRELFYQGFVPKDKQKTSKSHMPWLKYKISSTFSQQSQNHSEFREEPQKVRGLKIEVFDEKSHYESVLHPSHSMIMPSMQ